MSQTEIQSLCEIYIGRKFDEDDVASLRDFLRDLQVQKVKRAPEEKQAHHHEERKFVPVAERKQILAKEVAPGERPAPVSLAEFGTTTGAKDRAAAYAQNVNASSPASLSAARVESELGDATTKVADRKAQWVNITDQAPSSPRKDKPVDIVDETGNLVSPRTRDRLASYEKTTSTSSGPAPEVVKERLAEVTGAPGVKDRLGTWNQVTTTEATPDKSVVEERLAEVKGAAGVKDRAGAFASKDDAPVVGVRSAIDEVKGAPGVKDRLGNWDKVVSGTGEKPAQPKVLDLPAADVKSRKEGWIAESSKDQVIASTADPALAEARTAELKKVTSVRDRMGQYAKATEEKAIERPPVVIPTDVSELPTKETQGQ